MSILNRSSEFDHLYDNMGRLQGGLSSLEELAKVISIGNGADRDADAMDDQEDSTEPAKELPVSTGRPMLLDSDEDMIVEEPGSSDDEAMEEISMSPVPISASLPPESSPVQSAVRTPPQPISPISGSPTHTSSHKRKSTDSFGSGSIRRSMSKSSRQNSRKTLSSSIRMSLPLGERFKKRFLELNVLSTLLVSRAPHQLCLRIYSPCL